MESNEKPRSVAEEQQLAYRKIVFINKVYALMGLGFLVATGMSMVFYDAMSGLSFFKGIILFWMLFLFQLYLERTIRGYITPIFGFMEHASASGIIIRNGLYPAVFISMVLFLCYALVDGLTYTAFLYGGREVFPSAWKVFLTLSLTFFSRSIYQSDLSNGKEFQCILALGVIVSCLVSGLPNSIWSCDDVGYSFSGFGLFLCILASLIFAGLTAYNRSVLEVLFYKSDGRHEGLFVFCGLYFYLDFMRILFEIGKYFYEKNK